MANKLKEQTKKLKTLTKTAKIRLVGVQFYKTKTPHVKNGHPIQEPSKRLKNIHFFKKKSPAQEQIIFKTGCLISKVQLTVL